MLKCLEAEMEGKKELCDKLCKQGQIISQIHQLAEPMKRPPRDLVPRFFEKFEREESRAAFQEGVTSFHKHLKQRAIDKKKEEAEEERMQPVSLVEAMYQMTEDERRG